MTMENIKPRKSSSRSSKLQSVGYSFFVTLPLDWIEHHKLRRRDLIEFCYEDNGDLKLRPKVRRANK